MVAPPNANLLAGEPWGRGVNADGGGALPRRQRHEVLRNNLTEEQRNESKWVSVGNLYYFSLVLRVCKKSGWISSGGGAKLSYLSVQHFVGKRGAVRELLFFRGGGRESNVNRQNSL